MQMCDRYVVGEIQGYDVIYIPEKDIVFCKNTAIRLSVLANQCEVKADDIKYSVQSYLRQVELSRTKDMSVTPEKKFVDSLLDILHLPKNEETMRRFIKMMEEHCDGSIDDYKD